MKRFIIVAILLLMVFEGCRAKRSYNTAEGKKKLKHYNSILYK
jgi:hypothetical protein